MAAWFAPGVDHSDPAYWLEHEPIVGELDARLWPVLQKLWGEAYWLGYRSGLKVIGRSGAGVGPEGLIAQAGRRWLNEIIQTRLAKIAAILGSGLSRAETLAAIKAMLGNEQSAEMIAQTEVTRAVSEGAHDAYRTNDIFMVRWQTEEDNRVCPVCDDNEAAGPQFYGTPFPGGAIAPPQHPMCRCALMPA